MVRAGAAGEVVPVSGRFGHASHGYELLRTREDRRGETRARVHRAVFWQAYRLMNLYADFLGPWDRVLKLAVAGKPVSAGDVAWAQACEWW